MKKAIILGLLLAMAVFAAATATVKDSESLTLTYAPGSTENEKVIVGFCKSSYTVSDFTKVPTDKLETAIALVTDSTNGMKAHLPSDSAPKVFWQIVSDQALEVRLVAKKGLYNAQAGEGAKYINYTASAGADTNGVTSNNDSEVPSTGSVYSHKANAGAVANCAVLSVDVSTIPAGATGSYSGTLTVLCETAG